MNTKPAAAATVPPRQNSSWLSVVGIALLSSVLWSIFLLHSGSNYQERYNLQLSHAPLGPIASQGSPDDPMPLYFLLLHGYSALLGGSTLTELRMLSFACLILSIAVAYALGSRTAGNRRVGLWAACFIGLSPFTLWYASRATVYTLVILLTLINQYFHAAVLHKPRRWHWLGYGVSGLLGLGVHFAFLLMLIAQAIFMIVKHRTFTGWKRFAMAGCLVVMALAFIAWLHYSNGHADYWRNLPYTSRPSATNAFIIYVQYLFGFQSVVITTLIIALWPILVILALLGVQKYVRPPLAVQYSLWGAVVPVILALLLGLLLRPLFLTSYLVIAVAPFMLLLSWYFVAFELKTLSLVRNILLAGMIIGFFLQAADLSTALREDYLGVLLPAPRPAIDTAASRLAIANSTRPAAAG